MAYYNITNLTTLLLIFFPDLLQNDQTVGMQAPSLCLLCGEREEKISHLFFNCDYSRKNLNDVLYVTGHALWKQMSSPMPVRGMDVRAEDLINGAELHKESHLLEATLDIAGFHLMAYMAEEE